MPKKKTKKAQTLKMDTRRRTRKLLVPEINGAVDKSFDSIFYEETIKKAIEYVANLYGFKRMTPSIIESRKLLDKYFDKNKDFKKSRLISTSIKGSVLRADFIPGIIRMFYGNLKLKHLIPAKFWFFGDVFGSFEEKKIQTVSSGFMSIGVNGGTHDAQMIFLALRILKKLKINENFLKINSTGCKVCRKSYVKKLKLYYRTHKDKICKKCADEFKEDPLLLSGCVNKNCKFKKLNPPLILDSLCQNCKNDLKSVLGLVEEADIKYILDPFMFRGWIWNRTIFKIEGENGKRLIYGGRMGNLNKYVLGARLPTTGLFIDYKNLLEEVMKNNRFFGKQNAGKIFVINICEEANTKAIQILEELYNNGISAYGMLNGLSLKSKLDNIKKAGGELVLIIGQKETYDDSVILRNIKTGEQKPVVRRDMINRIKGGI